jgi:hypothetical protein
VCLRRRELFIYFIVINQMFDRMSGRVKALLAVTAARAERPPAQTVKPEKARPLKSQEEARRKRRNDHASQESKGTFCAAA